MKKVKLKLELQYNSPVILTFFLLSLLVLFLDQWTDGWTTMHLFCVYRSSLKDPLFYIRLFGHVLGHASWDHFLNNMLLLLVVGPVSYTHLDVYKRQAIEGSNRFLFTGAESTMRFSMPSNPADRTRPMAR